MENVILLLCHNANLASIKILVKGFGIDRIDDILSPVCILAYYMLHNTTDIGWNNK